MVDEKKQNYYIKNRRERLQYQKDYYELNKENIKKGRAKRKLDEPSLVDKEQLYHRKYYEKNKERIMKQRRYKRSRINRPL